MPWYLLTTWFAHRVTQMSRRSPQYLRAWRPGQARLWLQPGQTLARRYPQKNMGQTLRMHTPRPAPASERPLLPSSTSKPGRPASLSACTFALAHPTRVRTGHESPFLLHRLTGRAPVVQLVKPDNYVCRIYLATLVRGYGAIADDRDRLHRVRQSPQRLHPPSCIVHSCCGARTLHRCFAADPKTGISPRRPAWAAGPGAESTDSELRRCEHKPSCRKAVRILHEGSNPYEQLEAAEHPRVNQAQHSLYAAGGRAPGTRAAARPGQSAPRATAAARQRQARPALPGAAAARCRGYWRPQRRRVQAALAQPRSSCCTRRM